MALSRRLLRELKKIKDEGRSDYVIQLSETNIQKWSVTLFGAKDTEWEGAVFHLEFMFSAQYLSVAPDVRFVGTIPFHPNVYTNGKICLDLLQHNWSSAFGVDSIITSIQTLLVSPNPNSPANNNAAVLFADCVQEYRRHVRFCVESTWTCHT
jgi:ubiquitin-conjugating enzyme E2 A